MTDHDAQSQTGLIVEGVKYSYGTAPALHDVAFSLQRGHLTALIGRNGAGKSTLLRCLAGWASIERGDVYVDGVRTSLNERASRAKMIMIPDTPPFYDELTAWEHLKFISQLHGVVNWKLRAEALLADFDLSAESDASPTTFSRGMRYKLALCMAFLVKPALLLLDEPFGPLDPTASESLWGMLRQYCADGGMVLFSSHTLPVDDYPDQFVVVDEGTVITYGDVYAVTGADDVAGWSLNEILWASLDE